MMFCHDLKCDPCWPHSLAPQVEEIAATEGLAVEEADVAAEVDLRKQQYEAQGVEYDEQAVRDQVLDTLKHIRVTEWLKVGEGVCGLRFA